MTYDRSKLLADLERDEGLKLTMYRCSEGYLTIGVGHNLEARPISERAARQILEDDVLDCLAALDRAIPWWRSLPEAPQRGLINMCFQLGIGGLLKFQRMLEALKARDWRSVRTHAMDSLWARQTPARAARVADLLAQAGEG